MRTRQGLVQMLQKGHQGVKLSGEAWDRIITWIDLNTPAHGTWSEVVGQPKVTHQSKRRAELLKKYANITEEPEQIVRYADLKGYSSSESKLLLLQDETPNNNSRYLPAADAGKKKVIKLSDGVNLELVKTGQNVWMGTCEVTNEQFALFDPTHDSRIEHGGIPSILHS